MIRLMVKTLEAREAEISNLRDLLHHGVDTIEAHTLMDLDGTAVMHGDYQCISAIEIEQWLDRAEAALKPARRSTERDRRPSSELRDGPDVVAGGHEPDMHGYCSKCGVRLATIHNPWATRRNVRLLKNTSLAISRLAGSAARVRRLLVQDAVLAPDILPPPRIGKAGRAGFDHSLEQQLQYLGFTVVEIALGSAFSGFRASQQLDRTLAASVGEPDHGVRALRRIEHDEAACREAPRIFRRHLSTAKRENSGQFLDRPAVAHAQQRQDTVVDVPKALALQALPDGQQQLVVAHGRA